MGVFVDDRTDEQRKTHQLAVIGTDRFMSGRGGTWGPLEKDLPGMSYVGWAFKDGDEAACLSAVDARKDMRRVRVVVLDGYRPKAAHTHIYVWHGQRFER